MIYQTSKNYCSLNSDTATPFTIPTEEVSYKKSAHSSINFSKYVHPHSPEEERACCLNIKSLLRKVTHATRKPHESYKKDAPAFYETIYNDEIVSRNHFENDIKKEKPIEKKKPIVKKYNISTLYAAQVLNHEKFNIESQNVPINQLITDVVEDFLLNVPSNADIVNKHHLEREMRQNIFNQVLQLLLNPLRILLEAYKEANHAKCSVIKLTKEKVALLRLDTQVAKNFNKVIFLDFIHREIGDLFCSGRQNSVNTKDTQPLMFRLHKEIDVYIADVSEEKKLHHKQKWSAKMQKIYLKKFLSHFTSPFLNGLERPFNRERQALISILFNHIKTFDTSIDLQAIKSMMVELYVKEQIKHILAEEDRIKQLRFKAYANSKKHLSSIFIEEKKEQKLKLKTFLSYPGKETKQNFIEDYLNYKIPNLDLKKRIGILLKIDFPSESPMQRGTAKSDLLFETQASLLLQKKTLEESIHECVQSLEELETYSEISKIIKINKRSIKYQNKLAKLLPLLNRLEEINPSKKIVNKDLHHEAVK